MKQIPFRQDNSKITLTLLGMHQYYARRVNEWGKTILPERSVRPSGILRIGGRRGTSNGSKGAINGNYTYRLEQVFPLHAGQPYRRAGYVQDVRTNDNQGPE